MKLGAGSGGAKDEQISSGRRDAASSGTHETVEAAIRGKLAEMVGGPRGSLEIAAPAAIFAFVYAGTGGIRISLIVAAGVALALFAARLIQGSSTYYVRNGLLCIVIGAALAYAFGGSGGRAENVFLPGIIVNAVFPLLLGASVLLRRPAFGFVIGEILGDAGVMHRDAGVMRLSDRITLLLMIPGVVRVCVELPLYLAGKVGWFGVTSLALGWPLLAVVVALAGVMLARGHTPLEHSAALDSR